jgi:hypothetical protein
MYFLDQLQQHNIISRSQTTSYIPPAPANHLIARSDFSIHALLTQPITTKSHRFAMPQPPAFTITDCILLTSLSQHAILETDVPSFRAQTDNRGGHPI